MDLHEKIIEMYKNGDSKNKIAKEVGISTWSVNQVVEAAGIKREYFTSPETIEAVRHYYIDMDMTMAEVANVTGLNKCKVKNIISNKNFNKTTYNIKTNKEHKPPKEVVLHYVEDPIFYVEHKPSNERLTFHKKTYRDMSAMILGG